MVQSMNMTGLDKEKLTEWLESEFVSDENPIVKMHALRIILAIDGGEFDLKCPECTGSGRIMLSDDPYYAETCSCKVDWLAEAMRIAGERYQLSEMLTGMVKALERLSGKPIGVFGEGFGWEEHYKWLKQDLKHLITNINWRK